MKLEPVNICIIAPSFSNTDFEVSEYLQSSDISLLELSIEVGSTKVRGDLDSCSLVSDLQMKDWSNCQPHNPPHFSSTLEVITKATPRMM